MPLTRRSFMLAAPTLIATLTTAASMQAPARIIRIEARKFRYAPDMITVQAGEPIILELTALDFTHGFSIPTWKVRQDLVVGQPVRVALQPEKAGTFTFLCDNFCGSGHEEMSGTIIVTA